MLPHGLLDNSTVVRSDSQYCKQYDSNNPRQTRLPQTSAPEQPPKQVPTEQTPLRINAPVFEVGLTEKTFKSVSEVV